MILHLSYVACDVCGAPAQPGDNAKEARAEARAEGYLTRKADLCPRCRPDRPKCPVCGLEAEWFYDTRIYYHCGREIGLKP